MAYSAYSADALSYDVITDMAPRELKGPVWILGKRYLLPKEKEDMMNDIRSKLWCTYRRNFRPISGTSLSCDTGWGCTLRCGQMILAQALICKDLGREYRWIQGYSNPRYTGILKKFLDIRDSEYSIQMIALQGADFGRQVGQWFGPNNVAQAIKKLAAHDLQSQLAVHVAMDMLVVIDDLKATAREPVNLSTSPVNVTDEKGERVFNYNRSQSMMAAPSTHSGAPSSHTRTKDVRSSSMSPPKTNTDLYTDLQRDTASSNPEVTSSNLFWNKATPSIAQNTTTSTGVTYLDFDLKTKLTMVQESPPVKEVILGDESMDFMKLSLREQTTPSPRRPPPIPPELPPDSLSPPTTPTISPTFRSLLLFIPLRLGQDSFNKQYTEALKACLKLPQSVGFIGGRPRHALYFIGYNENTLIYLDPHTTQQTVQIKEDGSFSDLSYHSTNYGRMSISGLDPSIALGFFCKDENDLDDLVERMRKLVLKDNYLSMFELAEHRPTYWGPFNSPSVHTSIREPFILVNEDNTDFDDFEIIEWPPVTSPDLPDSQPRHRSTPTNSERTEKMPESSDSL